MTTSSLNTLTRDLERADMSPTAEVTLPLRTMYITRPSKGVRLGTTEAGAPALVDDLQEAGWPFDRWIPHDELAYPPAETFAAFLDLHDAERGPDRILDFAMTHGLLGVCEHWDPVALRGGGPPSPCDGCMTASMLREPLPTWIFLAREYRAALKVAANFQQGHLPDREDLECLRLDRRPQKGNRDEVRWAARIYLEFVLPSRVFAVVEHCLQPDHYHRSDDQEGWQEGWWSPPRPAFSVGGLAAILTLQLASILSTPRNIFICSFCQEPYHQERKARSDKRHFCSVKCTLDAEAEDARQRYARRNPDPKRKRKGPSIAKREACPECGQVGAGCRQLPNDDWLCVMNEDVGEL